MGQPKRIAVVGAGLVGQRHIAAISQVDGVEMVAVVEPGPSDQMVRWCQTNSNQSQFAAVGVNLCGTKLTPLGKCGGSVEFEIVT